MKSKSIKSVDDRRELLRTIASAAGLALTACATAGSAQAVRASTKEKEHGEAEVTPGEDLMQEHGILERVLLIYDEAARRIEQTEQLDVTVVSSAAGIIRHFVEDYHEKLEEQFVFPRLQSAHREVELVTTLLRQHQRGREVTDDIVRRAGAAPTLELAKTLRSFAHMYRPHVAREDTVLFPAFRDVVGRAGYLELGEQFEDKEHELFGEHGFEKTVSDIEQLEIRLGIADLAKFTV